MGDIVWVASYFSGCNIVVNIALTPVALAGNPPIVCQHVEYARCARITGVCVLKLLS